MNPNLLHARAIQGRFTGCSIGIIDTIRFVKVARAAAVMEDSSVLSAAERQGIRRWFADYLAWMSTHKNGMQERDAQNNHGTCWVLQAAGFARFTGNSGMTAWCRETYRTALLTSQMAPDGSFPLELKRTKPFGYSLFNMDAMTGVYRVLATPEDVIWQCQLNDEYLRLWRSLKADSSVDEVIRNWPIRKPVLWVE